MYNKIGSEDKMTKKLILPFLLILFTGCAELTQLAEQYDPSRPLTNREVINGLKEALTIGAENAAAELSALDGYYLDTAVKISLPPEARIITENLSRIPGGDKLIEEVILRINRAAEDAAREAAPIFARAVTEMTIQDGFAILRGEKDAATQYLKAKTFDDLFNLYQPKINSSIDKPIVGGISTRDSWDTLTSQWNRIAGSPIGRASNLKTVNTELERFLTDNALDGLFKKLAQEEEKIRTNPAARVTELLKRVFG
jgi:hypothetical protein